MGWCPKEVRGYGFGGVEGNSEMVAPRGVWCEDSPLCDSYPSLIALGSSKDAWVDECWRNPSKGGDWNLPNPLMIRNWRMQSGFYKVLVGMCSMHVDSEDKVGWLEFDKRWGFLNQIFVLHVTTRLDYFLSLAYRVESLCVAKVRFFA